jgi:hypothetical protein
MIYLVITIAVLALAAVIMWFDWRAWKKRKEGGFPYSRGKD